MEVGRGIWAREWPNHQGGGGQRRGVAVIHVDYAFVTCKGMFKRSELSAEELKDALKVLVVYDTSAKGPSAHAVRNKRAGDDGFAAARVCEDIDFADNARVILRSDSEPALLQVVSDSLKSLRIQQLNCASPDGVCAV